MCRPSAAGSPTIDEQRQHAESAKEAQKEARQRELRRAALARCASSNHLGSQFGVISAFAGGSTSFNNRSFAGGGGGGGSFNSSFGSSPANSFGRQPSAALSSVLKTAGCFGDDCGAKGADLSA